ncbi:hypothetical protein CCY99_07315 [Helicobacter sp. 16-1353]|uniref:glycosyltransferase family 2 protein n=1 Tax=Helicobacter sp. 16-1353 TaxID=2004996 RepID=UPI000DCAF1B1|nr:glycosyltransferase family 2 protein [Helicobacter sp. 16-1353]RAX52451.1 hypothetical protein CCY99_07315 [Helicobacter sp. 16-1353]
MPNSTKKPFISIVMPVFNVENYIKRALDSCINQTLSDIEIIIVDDCGNDSSVEIAKSYAKRDPRIKILHNSQNLGLFKARIMGEKNASGEYILALDGDDFLSIFTCKALFRAVHNLKNNLISKAKLFKNLNFLAKWGGGR